MNTYEIKKCSKCKQLKHKSDFYVRSFEKNSRDSFCKECRIKMNLERYYKTKLDFIKLGGE